MNSSSSLSPKDLLRSCGIALVLMLTLATLARGQESAPAAAETPAAAAETAPGSATVAPTVPPETPPPENEKSTLRRLDNLPSPDAPTVGSPAPSRRTRSLRVIRPSIVQIQHSGHERVAFGHDAILAAGDRADQVVSIIGSSTSEGEVSEDVVSVIGDTRVTGPIGGEAVAVLGNVYINSKVGGSVVGVLGDVELGPNAEVGGEVISVGGTLKRAPGSIVHGTIKDLGFSTSFAGLVGLRTWFRECLLWGRPLAVAPNLGWAWWAAIAFLGLYVFLGLVFRGGVESCVQTLEERPGRSVLTVLLVALLTPLVIILLAITGVGVVVIPFLVATVFIAGLFGRAVILAWLGRRFARGLAIPVQVLFGGIVVLALYTVPVLGIMLWKAIGLIGLGVVTYTLILAMRREKAVVIASTTYVPVNAPPIPSVRAQPFSTPPSEGFTSGFVAPETRAAPFQTATERSDPNIPASSGTASPPPVETPPASGTMPSGLFSPPVAFIPAATLPRAGFWLRTGAMMIDLVLGGIVFGALVSAGHLVLPGVAAYAAVMWKLRGTTVGGIICGLKVVRLDDRPLDWPIAIVRALACFVSLIVAGLGFIWVVFDDQRQSWHDKIAGTVVVKVPKGTSLI